jgi:hypothetical protein
VTFFGLLFTPVFYDLVIYWFGESESPSGGASATGPSGATAASAPTTGH